MWCWSTPAWRSASDVRAHYRRGIDLTLRRGGLLIGVWFINPALDPGELGPPFPFSVADLTALFAKDYEIVEDYVPDVAFPGREGRERVRVLRVWATVKGEENPIARGPQEPVDMKFMRPRHGDRRPFSSRG